MQCVVRHGVSLGKVDVMRCEVQYFVGAGAPGSARERIERCPGEACERLHADSTLLLVGDTPTNFVACSWHARNMKAKHKAGMTGGATAGWHA